MHNLKKSFFSNNNIGMTIRGVAWLGSQQVLTRVISVLRIAILARFLSPAEFGIFGIASIVLAFLETLTQTGVNTVLLQNKNEIDKYVSTAWVVSIARGIIIAMVIFASAPIIAKFFNSDEATLIIRFISLVPLLRGFINPSIIKFQKDLKFRRVIQIESSVLITDAFAAVLFTYLTRSPLGIVFGIIIGVLMEIILSFRFARPVPDLSFDKGLFHKIIGEGKWITGVGIFNYMANHGDDIMVSKMINTTSLGLYQAAYRVSMLPGSEITDVVSRVTFPVFTKISNDKLRLRKAFFKMLFSVIAIVVPISTIIFLFPSQVIKIVLGDQWISASPALQVLIIYGLVVSINSTKNPVFLALKKQKLLFKLHVIRFIVLAITIVPMIMNYGIVGAGLSSVISVFFVTPIAVYYLYKMLYK